MMQSIIQEQIANIMVLPNRICVPMAPGLDISRIKYPMPDVSLSVIHGIYHIRPNQGTFFATIYQAIWEPMFRHVKK